MVPRQSPLRSTLGVSVSWWCRPLPPGCSSYSLFPIPYFLFPAPCSLFPLPSSLFPIPNSGSHDEVQNLGLSPPNHGQALDDNAAVIDQLPSGRPYAQKHRAPRPSVGRSAANWRPIDVKPTFQSESDRGAINHLKITGGR